MQTFLKLAASAGLLAAAFASCGHAAEAPPAVAVAAVEGWSKWQGPRGDNVVREVGLAAKWPANGPKQLWKQPVGIGYSSPIAQGPNVYCFFADGNKEILAVFDAAKGTPGWHESYDIPKQTDYPGTRATPTIDGDKIYTYGSTGMLTGRDLATGKQLWQLDVLKELKEQLLGSGGVWGQASSPLIVGDSIYVQGGKGGPIAIAVDKNTGKIQWQSQAAGTAGYAAIIEADVKGTKQLIVFGGDELVAMAPDTGKTIWNVPWKTQYDVNATTPIYKGGMLFVTSGYSPSTGRCAVFELDPAAAPKKLWEKKSSAGGIASRFQPAVIDGDFIFGNSDEKRGVLKCMTWPKGDKVWEASKPTLNFGGSIVRLAPDRLIAMGQDGKLYLLGTANKACTIISTVALFQGDDQVWATPLIYQGKLYAKDKESLVCLDMK